MALNNGPIFFLMDGTAESLARLPATSRLAHALGRRLSILHALGDTGGAPIDHAIAALPDEPAGVVAVSGANLDRALADLFGTGGILALTPTRRGPIGRLLMSSNYEQMLRNRPARTTVKPLPLRSYAIERRGEMLLLSDGALPVVTPNARSTSMTTPASVMR